MFIITLQEPKLMSIYDITKKAMSSHRGTWYSDREVLGMILKFENPQPMTSERKLSDLSLIHISEPTRQAEISYAVFCLKKIRTKPRRLNKV